MNVHIKSSKLLFISILTLCLPLFSFAAYPDEPNTNPPANGTMGVPLNTSGTAQVKTGDLSVNAFSAVLNSYFEKKLGIGRVPSIYSTLDVNPTVTLTDSLKNIQSGITYNGLTAMANYYGTYIAAPAGSGTITNTYALVTEPTAGKVGIGTITPASQLSVNGGIQVGDDTTECTVDKVGTLRWHLLVFETCNGSAWVAVIPAVSSNIVSCYSGQICGVAIWELVSLWNGQTMYRCLMASGAAKDMFNCDGQSRTIRGGSPWSNYPIPGVTSVADVFSCDPGYTFTTIGVPNANAAYPQANAIAGCLKQ